MGIDKPMEVFCTISIGNNIFEGLKYDNYNKNCKEYNKMIGGSKKNNDPPPLVNILKFMEKYKNSEERYKTEIIKYKNIEYTFKMYQDKEVAYYYLFKTGNENQNEACIHIIINKNTNICTINNILYQTECIPLAHINDKRGSTLLKLCLIIINKIKDRYKLKYIQLTDNSSKMCKNKHRIELHKMMILMTGDTWYGKYGFIPKEQYYINEYNENKKIMNEKYLKDVPNIKKYILYGHQKSKSNINIKQIINNYEYTIQKNYKVKEFISKFLLNYDNTCDIFYYFYLELYKELKLNSLLGVVFIKKL